MQAISVQYLTIISQESQELLKEAGLLTWPFFDKHVCTQDNFTGPLQAQIFAHDKKVAVGFASKYGTFASGFFRIHDTFCVFGYLFGVAFSVNVHDVKREMEPLVFFIDN